MTRLSIIEYFPTIKYIGIYEQSLCCDDAVPGEFGSQLDVRHLGWNPCRTLDSSLWISESRIVNYWCFYPEMM